MALCYNTFPKTSNTAATASTCGHSLIGMIELWRPTMKVQPPMTMQKPTTATAQPSHRLLDRPRIVTNAPSAPTNAKASPSATHSISHVTEPSAD